MDVYDREGLYRGSHVFKNPSNFISRTGSAAALAFEEVAHVLQLFVHGLSGRRMRLDTSPHP